MESYQNKLKKEDNPGQIAEFAEDISAIQPRKDNDNRNDETQFTDMFGESVADQSNIPTPNQNKRDKSSKTQIKQDEKEQIIQEDKNEQINSDKKHLPTFKPQQFGDQEDNIAPQAIQPSDQHQNQSDEIIKDHTSDQPPTQIELIIDQVKTKEQQDQEDIIQLNKMVQQLIQLENKTIKIHLEEEKQLLQNELQQKLKQYIKNQVVFQEKSHLNEIKIIKIQNFFYDAIKYNIIEETIQSQSIKNNNDQFQIIMKAQKQEIEKYSQRIINLEQIRHNFENKIAQLCGEIQNLKQENINSSLLQSNDVITSIQQIHSKQISQDSSQQKFNEKKMRDFSKTENFAKQIQQIKQEKLWMKQQEAFADNQLYGVPLPKKQNITILPSITEQNNSVNHRSLQSDIQELAKSKQQTFLKNYRMQAINGSDKNISINKNSVLNQKTEILDQKSYNRYDSTSMIEKFDQQISQIKEESNRRQALILEENQKQIEQQLQQQKLIQHNDNSNFNKKLEENSSQGNIKKYNSNLQYNTTIPEHPQEYKQIIQNSKLFQNENSISNDEDNQQNKFQIKNISNHFHIQKEISVQKQGYSQRYSKKKMQK